MKARPVKICGSFVADDNIPADHRGRLTCANCHCIGYQGDPHHPDALPQPKPRPISPALAAAARDRDAAILGEKEDDR